MRRESRAGSLEVRVPGRPGAVSHVGKLYNLATGLAADRIVASLPAVRTAECRMISRIGRPIAEPALVEVRVHGADPERDPELAREIERILREDREHLPKHAAELMSGDVQLDRWPLRNPIASPDASKTT